jgi:hypothetical protein
MPKKTTPDQTEEEGSTQRPEETPSLESFEEAAIESRQ